MEWGTVPESFRQPKASEGISVLMTPVGTDALKDSEQVTIITKTCFRRMYLAAVHESD